jgi:mannose/cellobiose epimerase-like protein (N-acyl-D-glucosamine 2-epimerase family)
MKNSFTRITLLCLAFVVTAIPGQGVAAGLPDGQIWLQHLRRDLLPFWGMPAAMGRPVGNFPTFRCNDGSAFVPDAACAELEAPPAWIQPELGRTYVRMQARQTYAYGVAFNLTGERRWLDLAKAGARRTVAMLDLADGAPTWFEQGRGGPAPEARTAQDQAYAMVGIAMLYYLTRDKALERALIAQQRFVFDRYWDEGWGMLGWVPRGGPRDEAAKQELVAQLDQLNAYMLLVVPYLPRAARDAWHRDIRRVADALVQRFHDPASATFFGTLERGAESRSAGARHNDFGHTIKAYWMLLLAGRELADAVLERFGREGGLAILDRAWDVQSEAWASGWRADGIDRSKSWWIFAELDQMASFMALERPAMARRLASSWDFWLKKQTAANGGEVHAWVDPNGVALPGSLRIHHWKSGYHSFEHALVSYLTAQALAGKPGRLYFAAGKGTSDFRPYLLPGRVISLRRDAGRQRVDFVIPVATAKQRAESAAPATSTRETAGELAPPGRSRSRGCSSSGAACGRAAEALQ